MKLYEIDAAIMECVDEETGEILNAELLDLLSMEREKKIEGIALWIKNLNAELEGVKNEKRYFAERQKRLENKILSLEDYLSQATCHSAFKTEKCDISFRKSTVVVVDDVEKLPEEYVTEKVERVPNKALIKEDIKIHGAIIEGAELLEKLNIKVR